MNEVTLSWQTKEGNIHVVLWSQDSSLVPSVMYWKASIDTENGPKTDNYLETLKVSRFPSSSKINLRKIINSPLIADEKSQKWLWMKGEKSKSFILYGYYFYHYRYYFYESIFSSPTEETLHQDEFFAVILIFISMILIHFFFASVQIV